jgi:glutamyl-tRNA synthetase
MGYLPAALRNYLARLGWSHGDDEIFSTSQLVEWFELGNIGKSPARFDFAKLENLNGHYIRHMDDDTLVSELIAFLPHAEGGLELLAKLDDAKRGQLRKAMAGLKERAKTLVELKNGAAYLFAVRPLTMNEKAKQIIADGGKGALLELVPVLNACGEWKASSIEAAVKTYAEANGIKLGKLAQPLRAALTGTSTSPPIFDVLEVLGRDESFARIGDMLN